MARSFFAIKRSLIRSHLVVKLTGWFFAHMNDLLPVDRLTENTSWIAFHHPESSYPLHILLVPKRAITDLTELGAGDSALLTELVEIVQRLIIQFDLQKRGYRLITNGGPYQSIPQLHFHLISEK